MFITKTVEYLHTLCVFIKVHLFFNALGFISRSGIWSREVKKKLRSWWYSIVEFHEQNINPTRIQGPPQDPRTSCIFNKHTFSYYFWYLCFKIFNLHEWKYITKYMFSQKTVVIFENAIFLLLKGELEIRIPIQCCVQNLGVSGGLGPPPRSASDLFHRQVLKKEWIQKHCWFHVCNQFHVWLHFCTSN